MAEEKVYALTTVDNPFDPFDQFDEWLNFDSENGYYSPQVLMRIANIRNEMSEKEVDDEIERAIDRIVELDFTKTFKKAEKTLKYDEKDLEKYVEELEKEE